jgi:dihydroorotase-like cyclic amidohydrolase
MNELTLPGLIDVHTHLRVPGGEHKEDFATGTAAALAGGITVVLGMPNTSPPLSTRAVMETTRANAAENARCDVGLYAGASPSGIRELPELAPYSVGLKIYLNDTFGLLRVDEVQTLRECFKMWPRTKLIAMHAEKQSVAVGIGLAATYDRHVHFCHVSRREEIELIADAKSRGLPITCEVAPHHLYMTVKDFERMGTLADMRPVLGTESDQAALWEHINTTVDCVATDHAPHTIEEKRSSNPPPGIAGLEASLPLMLRAVHDGRITVERLVELMYRAPKRIFDLPDQPNTEVTVDMTPTTFTKDRIFTKCGWSPFEGIAVGGTVRRVVLRGRVAFEEGKIVAAPGTGMVLPQ